jgi:RNA methyltransferase, TrmH family
MSAITSPHNHRLQELRRLHRRRERARSGRFLAEGEDLIAAAATAGWEPVVGYRVAGVPGGAEEAAEAMTAASGPRFVEVAPAALAAVSTLGSGTRAVGVYEQRWSARPAGPLCVYLHALADPGNVGAVLRAARAFGASCVALGPRCADPWSPKAVRASMGAIFYVPLAHAGSIDELPGERIALVADQGRETLARGEHPRCDRSRGTLARGEHSPCDRSWGTLAHSEHPHSGQRPSVRPLYGPARGPLTLLVGAEREGLPEELLAACESAAHIPIACDSLNAAMAATIALYEMTRGAAHEHLGLGHRMPPP